MSAAHTPGPWRVERDGDAIEIHSLDNPYASGPCVIAEVPTDFGEESALADGKLIAAAPALADALEKIVAGFDDDNAPDLSGPLDEARAALRAAGRLP